MIASQWLGEWKVQSVLWSVKRSVSGLVHGKVVDGQKGGCNHGELVPFTLCVTRFTF